MDASNETTAAILLQIIDCEVHVIANYSKTISPAKELQSDQDKAVGRGQGHDPLMTRSI